MRQEAEPQAPPRPVAPGPEGEGLRRARRILEGLRAIGVREVCLCPGGRNAPFVEVLDRASAEEPPGLRVLGFFEERAAAFFALGRARATGRPVAVLTTSGTAAAELLPAIIEAHYSGHPLIALSADRPASFRGSGAPQAIEQVGLFGAYAPTVELATDEEISDFFTKSRKQFGPLHLNVPLDEPLLDGEAQPLGAFEGEVAPWDPEPASDPGPLGAGLASLRRPLVILGGLPEEDREPVARWLARYRPLIYAEGPSGLREHPSLRSLTLRAGEGLLRPEGPLFGGPLAPDGALLLGAVPTTRLVRDLAGKLRSLPCLSAGRGPYAGIPGLPRLRGPLSPLLEATPPPTPAEEELAEVRSLDARLAEALEGLLSAHPRSEAALVRAFSRALGEEEGLYVGNSMPIRLWDLAAERGRPRPIACSRGANGIDGQLSAFLGGALGKRHWGLFGDLTALYDLSAPWALSHLGGAEARFAILNNGGGGIFERLFRSPTFRNAHALGFEGWARMWGLSFAKVEAIGERLPEAGVLEILPERAQSLAFFEGYDSLFGPPRRRL